MSDLSKLIRVSTYLTLLHCLLIVTPVASHSRWICPEPRSSDTGIKDATCGSDTGKILQFDQIEDIAPGPLTVAFEESVAHTGAPWRISLTDEGTDEDSKSCILLDHIPHDENSSPTYKVDSTYHKFYITIEIPDVKCEKCSLQLANPMTDKIGSKGKPDGEGCTDPYGSCFSVYYSCTKPFRITGKTRRSEYQCPGQPADWPKKWISPDTDNLVDASVVKTYRREYGVWDQYTHFLKEKQLNFFDVPEKYRTAVGRCVDSEKHKGLMPAVESSSTTTDDSVDKAASTTTQKNSSTNPENASSTTEKAILPSSVKETTITTTSSRAMQQAGSCPLLIDVRTVSEWNNGHAPCAHRLPVQDNNMLAQDIECLANNNKAAKIYVYCNAPDGRSARSRQTLEFDGFTNVDSSLGWWNQSQQLKDLCNCSPQPISCKDGKAVYDDGSTGTTMTSSASSKSSSYLSSSSSSSNVVSGGQSISYIKTGSGSAYGSTTPSSAFGRVQNLVLRVFLSVLSMVVCGLYFVLEI